MPKFRNVPKEIEAVRFDPEGVHKDNLPMGVIGAAPHFRIFSCGIYARISAGNWIITEPDRGTFVDPDRGDGLAPEGCEPVEEKPLVGETAVCEILVGDKWIEWYRETLKQGFVWDDTSVLLKPQTRVRILNPQ